MLPYQYGELIRSGEQLLCMRQQTGRFPHVLTNDAFVMLSPAMEFSPTGTELLVSNYFCSELGLSRECDFPDVLVVNVVTGQIRFKIDGLVDFDNVTWSFDGSYFAVSGTDVFIHDAATYTRLYTWADTYDNMQIEWASGQQTLIGVNERGKVDLQTPVPVTILRIEALERRITAMD